MLVAEVECGNLKLIFGGIEHHKHRLPMLQKGTRRSSNTWSLESKLSSLMQQWAARVTLSVQYMSKISFQQTQSALPLHHEQEQV